MYQAQRDEQTYIAEPGRTWHRFVKVLLWVNFAMLVLNAGLAVKFWLSGYGQAYFSLGVAFFSCFVIVFFRRFARRRGVVTLSEAGLSYRSPVGIALGPIAWEEIAEVQLERSVGRAWLWVRRQKKGSRVYLFVPWEDADAILARCQRELRPR